MKFALFSILNGVLHITHLALITILVAGWWFCETRLISLILIIATFFSWYGLKPLFDPDNPYGYCLITDMQWKLRRAMGLANTNGSYIKFLADTLSGSDFDSNAVNKAATVLFFACAVGGLATTMIFGWCWP